MDTPLSVTYVPTGNGALVMVDGFDISKAVSRFSVDHRAGELPKVFLELKHGTALPEGIDTDAIVHLREVVLEEPADATLRFLEPLDPEEFEKACLTALEHGGPTTFGEAALAVLRGYAQGKTGA